MGLDFIFLLNYFMGIKNLIKLVKKYASNAIKKQMGRDIISNDIIVTHIYAMFFKLIAFKKYNITPIFVFDGKPHYIKEKTLKQRDAIRDIYKNKYVQAIND